MELPSSYCVERRSDGGLSMAATDAAFSVDTPAPWPSPIAAAVAPFNALPRPLGNGKFDDRGLLIGD